MSRGLRTVCTYGLRVLYQPAACCVLCVPEAQGSLPEGPTHCTYTVSVPASAALCVPRTVAPQVAGAHARRKWLHEQCSIVQVPTLAVL